jgi:hypothetical protein
MNKKRELYRRIRDSEKRFISIEEIRLLCIARERHDFDYSEFSPQTGIEVTQSSLHRLIERLRQDGVLVRTTVRGVYRVKEPEDAN